MEDRAGTRLQSQARQGASPAGSEPDRRRIEVRPWTGSRRGDERLFEASSTGELVIGVATVGAWGAADQGYRRPLARHLAGFPVRVDARVPKDEIVIEVEPYVPYWMRHDHEASLQGGC